MEVDSQIEELNNSVFCRLASSKIHGVGVFAIKDIPKGTKLNCNIAKPTWYQVPYNRTQELNQDVRELILGRWPTIVNGSYFLSPNDHAILILFMNHSDNPNYDQNTDCALRDILKDEEVTEDYRLIDNYKKVFDFL